MTQSLIPQQEKKVVRSELNIEKWPIFATSTFRGKSREFKREIITEDGKIFTKKVIIGKIADKEVGVLRILEKKGFYALEKIWEQAGKPIDESVTFSVHQVAEIIERTWGRTTHRQIKNMIDRLRFTPIKWVYSWKTKDSEEEYCLEDGFTILEEKKIFEKKEDKQMVFSFSSFKFHKAVLKNLMDNYTKPLYLDILLRFKKEISMLLYPHLDLIMADKNCYERKSKELFNNDLDLGDYKYPSQRKRLLEPALEELEGVELTTGILNYARLEKTTDGKDWKVVFKKSKKRLGVGYKKEQEKTNNTTVQAIEFFNQKFPDKKGMLIEGTVEKLISEYSLDKVILHISRISNDGSVNNPAGLLRMSLEKNWDLAPTKEEIQEKEKQAKDEQEKKQREEQQREKERYLKEKTEEERLNNVFFSLPSEEQERLKEEAKRLIIEQYIEDSQEKENKFFLIDTMVMIKVREILKERELIANCDIHFGTLETGRETVNYGN